MVAHFVVAVRGRGYVVVQMPDKERELCVEDGSALDGCLLEPWLEQPRALAPDGQQMKSRFVVVLRDAVDLAWFAPDQMRVFLSGTARSAAGIADISADSNRRNRGSKCVEARTPAPA